MTKSTFYIFITFAFLICTAQQCNQPSQIQCERNANPTAAELNAELTKIANCTESSCVGGFGQLENKTILLYDNWYPHPIDIAGQNLTISEARSLANSEAPQCSNGTNKVAKEITFRTEGGGGPVRVYIDVEYACCAPTPS